MRDSCTHDNNYKNSRVHDFAKDKRFQFFGKTAARRYGYDVRSHGDNRADAARGYKRKYTQSTSNLRKEPHIPPSSSLLAAW